jgi:predicted DNA repair protein MutK
LRHDDHDHDIPATLQGPDAESKTIAGAIRTDFILSAEIMVISLKEVLDEPIVARGVILVIVGVLITVVVYGVVALIVKMDDFGLQLAERPSPRSQRIGLLLVTGMPKLLAWLSVIGTAAMLWVGGHILLVGFDELGWTTPYHLVHELEHVVQGVPVVGGVLAWVVNTAASALVGFVVGGIIATVVARLPFAKSKSAPAAHH